MVLLHKLAEGVSRHIQYDMHLKSSRRNFEYHNKYFDKHQPDVLYTVFIQTYMSRCFVACAHVEDVAVGDVVVGKSFKGLHILRQ